MTPSFIRWAATLAAVAGFAWSTAFAQPTNLPTIRVSTVSVDTNGVLVAPTNFFTQNAAAFASSLTNSAVTIWVDTVADLPQLAGPQDGAAYIIRGIHSVGDIGVPATVHYVAGDTSPTNEFSVFAGPAGGRYRRAVPMIDASMFGVSTEAGTNNSAAIQRALYAAYSNAIPCVRLPPGWLTINDTIRFPPGVRISGYGALGAVDFLSDSTISNATISSDWETLKRAGAMWGATVLARSANQIGPVMEFDTSLAVVNTFYPTNVLQDGSVVARYQASSVIEGLVIFGRNLEQTSWDQDAIKAPNVWDLTIRDCAFIRPRGYAINVQNGNGIKILNCAMLGSSVFGSKGILGWHLSDLILQDCYFFGGRGPGLWVAAVGGWRTLVGNSFFGNFDGYGWKTITNCTAGVFTTSGNHELESGMPVVLSLLTNSSLYTSSPTSILPTNAIATNTKEVTLWVTKFSDSTFGLHTNSTAYLTNGYLDLIGGSPPYFVAPGFAVGLYVSDGSKQGSYNNLRLDQNFDGGIRVAGGSRNVFTGCIAVHNGVETLLGAVVNRGGSATNIANVTITGAGNWTGSFNQFIGTVVADADHGFLIEGNAVDNEIWGTAVDYSDITGAIFQFESTSLSSLNPSTVGGTNWGTSLRVRGGTSGAPALQIDRSGVAKVGIGLTGSTLQPVMTFIGERTSGGTSANAVMAHVDYGSTAGPLFRVGRYGAQSSAQSGFLVGGEDGSGTNSAGGVTFVDAGRGTGNQTNGGYVSLRVPVIDLAVTNSVLQTNTEVLRGDFQSLTNRTWLEIRWGNLGGTGVLSRINITNINGAAALILEGVDPTAL